MKLVRVAEPKGWTPCKGYQSCDINEGVGEPAIFEGGHADNGEVHYKLTEQQEIWWYRLDD